VLRLYPAYIVATIGVLALAWLFLMGRPPLDRSVYPSTGYDFIPDWINGAIFNPLKARTVIGNFAALSWSMNLVVWSLYVEVCAVPLLPLFHRIARQKNLLIDVAMLSVLAIVALVLWDRIVFRYWLAFYLGMLVQTRGQDCVRQLVGWAGGAMRAMAWAWLVIFSTCLLPTDLPASLLTQSVGAFAVISLIVWSDDAHPFRFLEHRWLHWNGRLSYSFYLWHYTILTVTARMLYAAYVPATQLHRLAAFGGTELFTIAAALAMAQLSYSYIEEPCLRWSQRLDVWGRGAAAPSLRPGFASRQVSPQGAD
jgi:peptidoglycan/LPS O-acetylase OafA/YrhL